MDNRLIKKAFGILLACCFTLSGTVAFSGESVICNSTSQLKRIVQHSRMTQSVASPVDAITILKSITSELKTTSDRNSSSALKRVSNDLSNMAAEFRNVAKVQHQDIDAIGSDLFRRLSDHLEDLNLVEGMFGCKKAEKPVVEFPAPNTRQVLGISGELRSRLGGVSATVVSYSVVAIIVVLISLAVAYRFVRRSPDDRKICRTSMLIVYGDQCTVTHITDMSRAGMKIEAAQKDVGKMWVNLYFCGHKVQGKIVWRNAYFAGIKFKTRVSQQTLDDVIERSHKPLGESGLEKNATPCFSFGCHNNCPHHLPTAISKE